MFLMQQHNWEDIFIPFQNEEITTINQAKVQQHNIRLSHRYSEIMVEVKSDDDKLIKNIVYEQLEILSLLSEMLSDMMMKWSKYLRVNEMESLAYHSKNYKIRQNQLFMILFLIENKGKEKTRSKYQKTFDALQKFKISLNQLQKPINSYILSQILNKQKQYLQFILLQYKQIIKLLSQKQINYKSIDSRIKNCTIKISKIGTIIQIFSYASVLPIEDLLGHDKNKSQRWTKLKNNVYQIKILDVKQKVNKQFNQIKKRLNIVNSSMYQLKKAESTNKSHNIFLNFQNTMQSLIQITKNIVSQKHAKKNAQILISKPDKKLAKQIWNLTENPYLKSIIQAALPKVTYSQILYLPQIVFKVDYDKVVKWNKNKDYDINKQSFIFNKQQIRNKFKYTKQLFRLNQKNQEYKIPVRLNSYCKIINIHQTKQKNIFQSTFQIQFFKKIIQFPQSIIFHIHGGGFISMSSHVHQMYTRQWVNALKVPIFSVDYRKAPQFPYPTGLNDCFQAYMWLTTYLQQSLNIKPKKIILVGDSAGGNLVAALTILLIKLNARIPDGIVLCYPALNLNYDCYTPSLLCSLDDLILPHTFLKICLQEYIQGPNMNPKEDPFLSPIQVNDNILKKFPQTTIFVGNLDPFHDDCCRLAQRLMNLGKKVKLNVYDNFPHGFLQFDDPPLLRAFPKLTTNYSHIAIEQVQQQLRRLLV